jgi:hypothetical protein
MSALGKPDSHDRRLSSDCTLPDLWGICELDRAHRVVLDAPLGDLASGAASSVLIAKFVSLCGELGTNFAI